MGPYDSRSLVYEQVQEQFPKRNQVAQITIGITADTKIVGQQVGSIPLMQFLRENEKSLIQVGQNILSINQLQPYSSWQHFLPDIEVGLQAYRKVASPKKFISVALRYINQIEFEHTIELERFLNFRPFLGPDLPQEFGAFVMGIQIPHEGSRDILNIQLTTMNAETAKGIALLLDLNYILIKPEELDPDHVIEWINTAHARIEKTFEACITDQLRQTFQEVAQQ